jgi:competence protein ComEC
MEALLIGSRQDVTAELYDSFRRTGSLHILALSGLHVSVIYGFLILVLGFLPSRGLRLVIATLVLLCYQVIAGFMPSLLRATIMICLAGICIALDRDREPLNLLSLSGIAILLIDPHEAFSLSFQLSFLALAGILLLGPLVQRSLEGRLPRILLAPLAMSLGAQMATLPLVVARFGAWFPSGILAGLVLVPLTTAMLWAGLGWILLTLVPLPLLHDAGARGLAILYGAIDQSARVMGRLPGISFTEPFTTAIVVSSAAALLCFAVVLPRRRRAVP